MFRSQPRNPNDFVKKFINESKFNRVQLEMIYQNRIILQVDSLKFVPSWFEITEVDSDFYKNGYVVFFILEKTKIKENPSYQNYLKSKLKMIEIQETQEANDIITFCFFLENYIDYVKMSNEMRKVVDNVYSFKDENPQILFNLRYINIQG
ncbi:hypothetical protein N9E56_01460 [Flavobacteriaceae bacterium]|nr:hypothetical protein [Flavobacteriaceae bacterium]